MLVELTNGAGAGAGAAGGSGGAAVKWFCNLLKYHSRVSAGGGCRGGGSNLYKSLGIFCHRIKSLKNLLIFNLLPTGIFQLLKFGCVFLNERMGLVLVLVLLVVVVVLL